MDLRTKYIPMTEPAFYTLLSLLEPRHGYSIMQYVSAISENNIALGAGTLYGLLSRLTTDGLIELVSVKGTRKTYRITHQGMIILQMECERLHRQLSAALDIISQGGEPLSSAE